MGFPIFILNCTQEVHQTTIHLDTGFHTGAGSSREHDSHVNHSRLLSHRYIELVGEHHRPGRCSITVNTFTSAIPRNLAQRARYKYCTLFLLLNLTIVSSVILLAAHKQCTRLPFTKVSTANNNAQVIDRCDAGCKRLDIHC